METSITCERLHELQSAVVACVVASVARTSQRMSVSLVSTIKTTLGYNISAKRLRQFETNLESSLETIWIHDEVLLVRNGPQESKRLLLRSMEQVCLIISSALNALSELLILKLVDKNLKEYWSFIASLSRRHYYSSHETQSFFRSKRFLNTPSMQACFSKNCGFVASSSSPCW
jgi:hypothetical protein